KFVFNGRMNRFLRFPVATFFLLIPIHLRAQETLCGLFKDLKASAERPTVLAAELIISKDGVYAVCDDGDNYYRSSKGKVVFHPDPFTLRLPPSPSVSANQIRQLQATRAELNRVKAADKPAIASATFHGRLRVDPESGLPTDFTFDSIENLRVELVP